MTLCPECGNSADVVEPWSVVACGKCGLMFRARPAEAARHTLARQMQNEIRGRRVVVVEDVRSQHNVGAIFRTADGTGWDFVCLSGICPIPPAKGILKTALGAHEFVPWTYRAQASEAVDELRSAGYTCVALDNVAGAVDLASFAAPERLALVVGNELWGLSPETLRRCDAKVYVPMRGQKRSLNVSVAFGIAAYALATSASP